MRGFFSSMPQVLSLFILMVLVRGGRCVREGKGPEAWRECELEVERHQAQLHERHQHCITGEHVSQQVNPSTSEYKVGITRYHRRYDYDRQRGNECRRKTRA